MSKIMRQKTLMGTPTHHNFFVSSLGYAGSRVEWVCGCVESPLCHAQSASKSWLMEGLEWVGQAAVGRCKQHLVERTTKCFPTNVKIIVINLLFQQKVFPKINPKMSQFPR